MSGIFSVIHICLLIFYLHVPSTATKSYPFVYKFLCIFTRIKATRGEREWNEMKKKGIFPYKKVTFFMYNHINIGLYIACILCFLYSIHMQNCLEIRSKYFHFGISWFEVKYYFLWNIKHAFFQWFIFIIFRQLISFLKGFKIIDDLNQSYIA